MIAAIALLSGASAQATTNEFADRVFATQTIKITRPYEAAVTGASNGTANATVATNYTLPNTTISTHHTVNGAAFAAPQIGAVLLGAAVLLI